MIPKCYLYKIEGEMVLKISMHSRFCKQWLIFVFKKMYYVRNLVQWKLVRQKQMKKELKTFK